MDLPLRRILLLRRFVNFIFNLRFLPARASTLNLFSHVISGLLGGLRRTPLWYVLAFVFVTVRLVAPLRRTLSPFNTRSLVPRLNSGICGATFALQPRYVTSVWRPLSYFPWEVLKRFHRLPVGTPIAGLSKKGGPCVLTLRMRMSDAALIRL